jgi:membrane-associated protease RseP (regulator of RpoE activity)
LGIKFTEYDVSRDDRAAEEMVRISGQMGVPVIMIDGEVVVGFDRQRIQSLVGGSKLRFGLKIADADRAAQKKGVTPVFGALIGEVAYGSLGEKAGLKPGDVITEISGHRVSNAADLERSLGGLRSGSIVSILFLRGEENRKSELVI